MHMEWRWHATLCFYFFIFVSFRVVLILVGFPPTSHYREVNLGPTTAARDPAINPFLVSRRPCFRFDLRRRTSRSPLK